MDLCLATREPSLLTSSQHKFVSSQFNSQSSKNNCPRLPLELWIRIIGFITDSRYIPRAWLDFRRVSWSFKAATELAFCDRHLRNTEIIFRDCSSQAQDGQHRIVTGINAASTTGNGNGGTGRQFHLKFEMEFQGLTEDRSRAIFRKKPVSEAIGQVWLDDFGCNLADLAAIRWRQLLQSYCDQDGPAQHRDPGTPSFAASRATTPAHVIRVRRVANDTALPGFQVHRGEKDGDVRQDRHDDTGTPELVSVLWQPMLSQLFGEEEYIKWAKKVDYQHSAMRKNMDAISAMVRKGDLPLNEFFKLMSDYTARNSKRVLDTVRKERLGRQAAVPGCGVPSSSSCSAASADMFRTGLDIVERVRESLLWDDDTADEYRYTGSEENEGNYYDGTGRLFQGNTETNKPEDDGAVQAKMEECEVPGASWYAGSDRSEDDDVDMEW